jgi:cell division protein FtsA
MSRRKISAGIDIGTSNIRVVISEYTDNEKTPIIIGKGVSESHGLRHGYITDHEEATESINMAIHQAEKEAGVKIKKAFIAIGGVSLESIVGTGSVFISRTDGEISEDDIKKAIDNAEENTGRFENKQIIHAIPISFKIDGNEIFGKPLGMNGNCLEVQVLFIVCLEQHLSDFINSVENIGIHVEDVMAAPISASFITLTKRQKIAGCLLANIGAETLSIAVFENNIPISIKVFPIGGVEITNDIALGLRIPLDEAEYVKLGEHINSYPKKKLEDIVEARLSDIFELIDAHLKKVGKNGLLPAGIILTGGTSSIPIVENLAKISLKLPSKVINSDLMRNINNQISDASWSVAYGLCIMGLYEEDEEGVGIKIAKRTKNNLMLWIKQFLP